MTDSDTDNDDDRPPGSETDWLADSVYGYGYGYTKEQALMEMARHVHPGEGKESVEVDLIEHVGSATTSMGGWRVDEFVSGVRVEVSVDAFEPLTEHAIEANAAAERALDGSDRTQWGHTDEGFLELLDDDEGDDDGE